MIKKIGSKPVKLFSSKFMFFLVLVFLISQAFLILGNEDFLPLNKELGTFLEIVAYTSIVFFLVNLILSLTMKKVYRFFKKEAEIEDALFISRLYQIFIYVLASAFILAKLGVSAGDIAIVLGLVTTGIAFAIRDILLSFFVWIIILTNKPIRIGNYIKFGDDEGLVKKVGIFFIGLNSDQNIKIPNKNLLSRSIKTFDKDNVGMELKFSITRIPKDFELRSNNVQKEISKITGNDKHTISLDVKEDSLFLKINYYTQWDKIEQVRTSMIKLIHQKFSNNIKKKK